MDDPYAVKPLSLVTGSQGGVDANGGQAESLRGTAAKSLTGGALKP